MKKICVHCGTKIEPFNQVIEMLGAPETRVTVEGWIHYDFSFQWHTAEPFQGLVAENERRKSKRP